ncbi:hypothetical protein N8I77_010246 [Diaporthe amygdali]|uniref:UBX domain-containing protein 2 n=1 Tax=Phomopsis amygdali TaxID=1214568 RepID=A0AAD9S9G5_PHOAM|nr:hypothetical protein N8I77_010246 [Diaporthe amygdali]KAK2600735.1 hypothetical protein N8I77_010246 [Diaporthe amygdali]
MFFTGTLQEGISKALQETKLVVCFVTDDEEESKTWETEFLTDETIAPSLDKDAVALRLQAGSQEAGYLAAIFPLPKNPTLVIIKNGELKEYISAGTSKEEFVRRVSGAFQAQTAATSAAQPGSTPVAAAAAATAVTSDAPSSESQTPGEDTPASSSTPSSSEQQGQPSIAAITQEDEVRRQAARKEREALERRRREKEQEEQAPDPVKAKQNDAKKKAAQQLAERQRQVREDRARVLKRIEDDRAERKARDESNRVARDMERRAAAGEDVEEITAAAGEPAPTGMARRQHDQCALQARLFDGSTIRTRLPAKATLGRDVRKWIDEARTDGNNPYCFKVILTPLPNRSIDPATEEDQTLEELGLTPSSTLVLAPVDRPVPAYPSINAGLYNPVSHLIAAVLAFIGGILGSITGAVTGSGSGGSEAGSGAGQRAPPEQQDRGQAHTTGRDGGSASRIKGFQNPDDSKRDQQLYNGNSLNFEPRKDEDDKDK